jgi:hypothetical protein
MATYLPSLGFVEAKSDTLLFVYQRGSDTAYLLPYVDDIVLTASSPSPSADHLSSSAVVHHERPW